MYVGVFGKSWISPVMICCTTFYILRCWLPKEQRQLKLHIGKRNIDSIINAYIHTRIRHVWRALLWDTYENRKQSAATGWIVRKNWLVEAVRSSRVLEIVLCDCVFVCENKSKLNFLKRRFCHDIVLRFSFCPHCNCSSPIWSSAV